MASDSLPNSLQFNDGHLLAVCVYSILLIFSAVGNISVLVAILTDRIKSRLNRVKLFLLHLTLADLMVTFLLMPLEIGWAITVSWRAGDVACRVLSFFRVFGLYLSGFLLTCISVDRYFAVVKPLSLTAGSHRGGYMLASAWLGSAVCSFPQALIFHVEQHPEYPWFEQCVTFGSFPTPGYELAYFLFGFIFLYGFPLIMIVGCYCSILSEICKKNDPNHGGENLRRSNMTVLHRAKIRTLKMTVVIVSTFFLCWTPYNVISLWYHIDRESASTVDVRVQKCLFLFAVANSCVNPVVYGLFHMQRRQPTEISRGFCGNGRVQQMDKEPFKVRVSWIRQTESLFADASICSRGSYLEEGQRGRPLEMSLFELDDDLSGRAIRGPYAYSNFTITPLTDGRMPNDVSSTGQESKNSQRKVDAGAVYTWDGKI